MTSKHLLSALLLVAAIAAARSAEVAAGPDMHSYANIQDFRTTHIGLDLRADFAASSLDGYVDLSLEQVAAQGGSGTKSRELVLDTRDLQVRKVVLQQAQPVELKFDVGTRDAILGAPLRIQLPATLAPKFVVRVTYRSTPQATGLQWLLPSQTAGKREPFMYSQSEAIHARSWIPLQDTPQLRITYDAHIRTPTNMRAVMSADNDPAAKRDGDYTFHMPQAISSYLLALAVGDIDFRRIGKRTGVYAEPSVVQGAASEFRDLEAMLETCEQLFGPYRWGRYDLLVLPPSFMWGGMENPRLTFITPTVIAGDRSLVAVTAHELAHSWSGNLVTNGDWNSAWLNEGFTVYLERRILEALYGKERASMEDVLGLQGLKENLAELRTPQEQVYARLDMNLRGLDPDDAFNEVPYEKGRLFLGFLESRLGRTQLDAFLREYFQHFSFSTITTAQFLDYLNAQVLQKSGAKLTRAEVMEWMDSPGIPSTAALPHSDALQKVEGQLAQWLRGERTPQQLETGKWSTHEWQHFIERLPVDTQPARLAELDAAFHFTTAQNAEIAHDWLKAAVRAGYEPAYPRLEQFLTTIGRRKFVRDLYEELAKTPAGKERARRIYMQARPLYQLPVVAQLDKLLAANP